MESESFREAELRLQREARAFDLAEEFFDYERAWLNEHLDIHLSTGHMVFSWQNVRHTSLADFGRESLGDTWGLSGGIEAWTKTLADRGVVMIPSKEFPASFWKHVGRKRRHRSKVYDIAALQSAKLWHESSLPDKGEIPFKMIADHPLLGPYFDLAPNLPGKAPEQWRPEWLPDCLPTVREWGILAYREEYGGWVRSLDDTILTPLEFREHWLKLERPRYLDSWQQNFRFVLAHFERVRARVTMALAFRWGREKGLIDERGRWCSIETPSRTADQGPDVRLEIKPPANADQPKDRVVSKRPPRAKLVRLLRQHGDPGKVWKALFQDAIGRSTVYGWFEDLGIDWEKHPGKRLE